jgi:hypothetical protein
MPRILTVPVLGSLGAGERDVNVREVGSNDDVTVADSRFGLSWSLEVALGVGKEFM